MGKKLGIIAVLCCAFALCFTLIGCGGSVDKSNYLGDWQMTSGSDENLDEESIQLMESLGLTVTLTLNEDGTGSLNLFGEATDVTWEAKSNTEGTITYEGEDAKITLNGDELTLSDDTDASMTFKRIEGSSNKSA